MQTVHAAEAPPASRPWDDAWLRRFSFPCVLAAGSVLLFVGLVQFLAASWSPVLAQPSPADDLRRFRRALAEQEQPVERRVSNGANGMAVRARIQQFKQDFGGQFQQLLATELRFIGEICQPTREEFEQISTAGDEILETVIARYALVQVDPAFSERALLPSDPRFLIADALTEVTAKILPKDKAALYAWEVVQRTDNDKRVAVLCILAKLDRYLALTPAQRDQFQEVLENNCRESWCNVHVLSPGNHNFPRLPVNKLLPILTPAQKATWHNVYRQGTVRTLPNFGLLEGVDIQSDDGD